MTTSLHHHLHPAGRLCALVAGLSLAAGLTGCNDYEIFLVAGYAQESFSNDADVLFVIDNSSSMQDEASALALNFDTFISKLTDPSQGGSRNQGLTDAVDNYIAYATSRGAFLDYQLGITTTDVEATYGALYGDNPILTKGDGLVGDAFRENLLCHATCFAGTVASDPGYSCGDPIGTEITRQYLDCVCGTDWQGNCGSGTEEGLEAIYMAMCRSVENPPADCYEKNQFTEADIGSNGGFLRENSTLINILVTDEGDTSRRMAQGDGDPDEYAELFDEFPVRKAYAVIGPTTEECNTGGATTWGVERYRWFVDDTGGRWFDIAKKAGTGECVVNDFAAALEELGDLLNSLLDQFPLRGVPDVETIRVFVDGKKIARSEEIYGDDGLPTLTSGWDYLAAENAIEFHGDAIPDYNADVRIYYRPLSGMPRELPF